MFDDLLRMNVSVGEGHVQVWMMHRWNKSKKLFNLYFQISNLVGHSQVQRKMDVRVLAGVASAIVPHRPFY